MHSTKAIAWSGVNETFNHILSRTHMQGCVSCKIAHFYAIDLKLGLFLFLKTIIYRHILFMNGFSDSHVTFQFSVTVYFRRC